MKCFSTYQQAIIGLHERGFTEDFIRSGNQLVWSQQQVLLPPDDFEVLERHHFHRPGVKTYTVLGVVLKSVHARGILLCRQLMGKETGLSGRKEVPGQILYRSNQTSTISLSQR